MRRPILLTLIAVSLACATMNPPKGEKAWHQVEGTPVLWRDPGPIASRDLFWGTGSAVRAPKAPFTFISEDATGTSPTINVRDANEVEWRVKFAGTEGYKNAVHAEVAATRLVWALGYLVEENYFVESGTIERIGALKRAAGVVGADGSFRLARFEREDPSMTYTEHTWSLEANPFVGTRELSGIMILAAALNQWDLERDSTAIVQVLRQDRLEALYLFSGPGSAFGRMEGNLEAYRAERLVDGIRDGRVQLNHDGAASIDAVPLEHARWFANLVAQLTPDQVRRAFEAAGASAAERDGFSARFLEKMRELQQAVGSAITPMI